MIKKLTLLILISSFSVSFSQESYYNDVDLTLYGTQLKEALATKITASHTRVLEYTSGRPDVWDATRATDENPNNTNEVILFYGWEDGSDQDDTNDRARSKNLQDSGNGATFVWNREHVFPKSLANPILDTDIPGPATDAHHLRAADRSRNSARNNRKYGRGTGTSKYSTLDFHEGLDGPNTAAWYPGDEWKGDAARMIMYMYVHYGSVCLPTAVGVGSKQFTPDEMIDLFLKWNVEDPVSEIEKARNTYHGNTQNYAAQGNRNPFIDNPYLATRIWGGDSAEDRWGIYTNSDTEAPTTPTNVTLNNISLNAITVSWTASTDNIGVTGYNVYLDGILTTQTTNTSATITDLNTNTTYSFTVVAKDLINNRSTASSAVNGSTLQDTQAPSIPENVTISNITDSSFKVSWSASTDNNTVNGYEVFVNGNLNTTTEALSHTVSGLAASTTYSIEILAKDPDNNKSSKSTAVNATTTNGASNGITELFISEYVEPNGGNNKAIEIVNLSSATINLTGYSIRKQHNGGSWVDDLPLDKTDFLVDPSLNSIIPNDVFVIIHAGSAASELTSNADLIVPNNEDAPYKIASPVNFNGNDPVGLFKNGVLIDIIGEEGNSSKHIENATYRRKSTISEPNTSFDNTEWDILSANTFDDIGSHTSILSTKSNAFKSFRMFPNPTNGEYVYFSATDTATINIYTVLGKLVSTSVVTKNNNAIRISNLPKGIYLVKISSEKKYSTKKLIIN
ncbi:MAG: endonuclease [Polaribacter sp.]|nr:endonuclease [Polaribacter sp.]